MSDPYMVRRRRNRARLFWCILAAATMAAGAWAAPYLLVQMMVAR